MSQTWSVIQAASASVSQAGYLVHVRRILLKLPIYTIFAFWLIIALAGIAEANAGVPGPLIVYFGTSLAHFKPNLLWQWLIATMFMCVGIEAAIYKYLNLFKYPVRYSLIANIISLFAGIPLSLIGIIDPTWFVVPTMISIYVEWLYLKNKLNNPGELKCNPFAAVVGANILTNIILYSYTVIALRP